MLIKKSLGSKIFDTLNCVFMVALCFTIIIPFWDMIMTSFVTPDEAMRKSLHIWPSQWSFEAYKFAFTNSKILSAYKVTIARTIIGTVFSLFVNVSMAYGLSHKELPFHNFITTLVLIPMFVSGGLIPGYLNIRRLGLMNTFWVYVIPGAFTSYNVVLLRNYFQNMDRNLEEAALIDGANNFRIMIQIIIPLATPIIATIALWTLVAHWNAWHDCLYYITDSKLHTLQFVLRRLVNNEKIVDENAIDVEETARNFITKNLQAAVTFIIIAPIMAAYPFLQKYFVKGIMVGALKG